LISTVGIIPARGGSKGIPNKNLRLLCGKPLIAHTISSALDSNLDRVLVFTDSEEIQEVSISYGAEAPILRPAETATDRAHMFLIYKFAIEYLHSKNQLPHSFCALLPTSPLRTTQTINDTIEKIQTGFYDWVFSINEMEHHPYRAMTMKGPNLLEPFHKIESKTLWANRQELPKVYRFNGGTMCGLSKHALENTEYNIDGLNSYGTKVGFVEMSQLESLDIDSEIDLQIVSSFMDRKDT
jgi:CMP-N-acetylneuraminic acid synthetase